jgi:Tfp pilus assembly protein PilP
MRNNLILIIIALVAVWGCNKPAQEVSSAQKTIPLAQKKTSAPSQTIHQPPPLSPTEKTEQKDPPYYDPTGKPDPFQPTRMVIEAKMKGKKKVMPLEQFEVSDFELVGLVTGSGVKKAMVQDLTGKGFFIQVGTHIGKQGGKVIRITEKEVVIQEPYEDFLGRKSSRMITLKFPQT